MEIDSMMASAKAPSAQFTGDVWVEKIASPRATDQRAIASLVRFAPGARTAWHSHALGQTLHVVAGVARLGSRDGRVIEVHAGQTIYTPPGEEHWHGASDGAFMCHLAVLDQADDAATTTTWLEHVDDAEYGRRVDAEREAES